MVDYLGEIILFRSTLVDMCTVVAAGLAPVSAQFAKRGCPVSYRAAIWCQILSIDLDATV